MMLEHDLSPQATELIDSLLPFMFPAALIVGWTIYLIVQGISRALSWKLPSPETLQRFVDDWSDLGRKTEALGFDTQIEIFGPVGLDWDLRETLRECRRALAAKTWFQKWLLRTDSYTKWILDERLRPGQADEDAQAVSDQLAFHRQSTPEARTKWRKEVDFQLREIKAARKALRRDKRILSADAREALRRQLEDRKAAVQKVAASVSSGTTATEGMRQLDEVRDGLAAALRAEAKGVTRAYTLSELQKHLSRTRTPETLRDVSVASLAVDILLEAEERRRAAATTAAALGVNAAVAAAVVT